jgi:hypothetical protein
MVVSPGKIMVSPWFTMENGGWNPENIGVLRCCEMV